jgi:hypothetical protein
VKIRDWQGNLAERLPIDMQQRMVMGFLQEREMEGHHPELLSHSVTPEWEE